MGRFEWLSSALLREYPALPRMGLGLWLAWAYLAYSGSVWLSDVEMNGVNIAGFYIVSTATLSLTLLASTFKAEKANRLLGDSRLVFGAGIVASLGSAFVILAGPYYANQGWMFFLGTFLTGLGTAVLGLKCAVLYGSVPPRQVVKDCSASYLLLAFVYFASISSPSWTPVSGGPSFFMVVSFVLVPALASFVLSLPCSGVGDDIDDGAVFAEQRRRIPLTFWKMFAVVLIFSFVASAVRSYVVLSVPPADTLSSNTVSMLLRVAMAFVFAISVVLASKTVDFGRVYSFVMVASVAVVGFSPVLGVMNHDWSSLIAFLSCMFEFVVWCILSFMTYQKRISAVLVFGFGYGGFTLGSTLGWVVGVFALPSVSDPTIELVAYLGMALLVLVSVFVLFSEKDFDRLFAPLDDEESLEALFACSERADDSDAGSQKDRKGRFALTIDEIAEEHRLTPRETDVLRNLAMGYGSEAIADRLQVSWNTVRTHTRNVYAKIDVHSRQELMALVDERNRQRTS